MALCCPNTEIKKEIDQSEGNSCDPRPTDTLADNDSWLIGTSNPQVPNNPSSTLSVNPRSTRNPTLQYQPDVGRTGPSPTTHSNMKTKQAKEELDKSIDEDTTIEPKTRARKKASDVADVDKTKPGNDEPKTSKEPKKNIAKPKAVVKKRPLGIRKTLRSKKAAVVTKEKVKAAIKQKAKRGRKPTVIKTEPDNSQDKEAVPLIPASEIKKEPVEDTTPNSRSSSPRTAGRRPRLSSDMIMMKSMLENTSSNLALGLRTSPYSMRSERSNSPSLFEGKNLRSGKPRKVKSNLLNEVVMKEQKKRRRLLSDSKPTDATEATEDCKKLKRGRSCSRDGSEISKCSDITESDLSLNEALNDSDSKELNKKLDKPKTDLDIDIENNVQISTIEKVPSLNVDSKLAETKPVVDSSCIINEKNKKKLSLKRSTSLDSDNNNSNRLLKLENLNSSDVEDKSLMKTENDTLFAARSSILTSMSKTFNSKEVSKNIRKARRGRKAASSTKTNPGTAAKSDTNTTANDTPAGDKQETLESLSKEINDLINNLDQNLDQEEQNNSDQSILLNYKPFSSNQTTLEHTTDQLQVKTVSKFYGTSKPLGDNNSIVSAEIPKDKESFASITNECTPTKTDDSENIRLHYEEDSMDQSDSSKQGTTYKCSNVASIDLLMDRLKEFEEFDKRRQRQESESKSSDGKSVMVTNDVVLIPKSGADIKLKDIQTVRSPEKPFEKENFLSCFENNSAISIVKREQVRRSIDIDLPNSVTLIKRNSISARKESTSSNHSRESDAISIFEKSLGKDVTLTEIRKSVDRHAPTTSVDLHSFATLHPNNPNQTIIGVVLDPKQISIMPRVMTDLKISSGDVQHTKRPTRESLSRKSSESVNEPEEKMATLEKIKSPLHQVNSSEISIKPTPVAVKSPEATLSMETEALAPPLENVKAIPDDIPLTSEVPKVTEAPSLTLTSGGTTEPKLSPLIQTQTSAISGVSKVSSLTPEVSSTQVIDIKIDEPEVKVQLIPSIEPLTEKTGIPMETITLDKQSVPEKMEVEVHSEEKLELKQEERPKEKLDKNPDQNPDKKPEKTNLISTETEKVPEIKLPESTVKSTPVKESKSTRNSTESQPGPSSAIVETPESQKRKENVLRTLGLLTHKAAKEAKIEKLKEKERIYNGLSNKKQAVKSGDYTGTLKTVIKLNRNSGDRDKKKYRSSLKMTFQKSKHRSGKPAADAGEEVRDDEAYYTIERREAGASAASDGGHRKSHYSNRLNNHDTEAAPEPVEPKETQSLVIPEKASSFSIHPGRLCQDQCFYCGGKFGLFDTPCHIAQMKSSERQKKVLANEEKLTIDSCLCDACYRHVDRRANCPSYRKRPLIKQPDVPLSSTLPNVQGEKPLSPPLDEESEDDGDSGGGARSGSALGPQAGRRAVCHTEGCAALADRSIRRKWLIKMRSSVNKLLKLEGDYPGLHTIPLCAEHYRSLAPLMACVLCRRRVTKHHNVHFVHAYQELNPLLHAAGIPAEFSERLVLCKMCRYYCTLLQRPGLNDKFARAHRRKLFQVYNIEVPPESDHELEEATPQDDSNSIAGKQKKKARTKSKQRRSTEKRGDSESSEKTESSPEKDKANKDDIREEIEVQKILTTPTPSQPLEEDIESLISSNKIMVPGAKVTEVPPHTDGEEDVYDFDSGLIAVDKQTELQYLLQKQNNPAQFLQIPPNLAQKQKSITKIQSVGIMKPGLQQRIQDKHAKKIQKLGQIITQIEKTATNRDEIEMFDPDKPKEVLSFKNLSLNDECTIESIPNKKPADINTLKNKWQMSESFTQVKKNLSELSKKFTVEKDPKKASDIKYSNPVKRLETNPSISVRELFPGEEEMNLQCNIEFNTVKGVTPEGWEKCNTMIQYDVETKKLWTELQRPYGNQSSFLRHLILLEKYFRSGDLVLSHNATPPAANYSDSVQSRLRAYDNVVNDTPRRSEPVINLIEYRKKPSINGKSLLKSSQESDKDPRKFMPPPGMLPKKPKDKSKAKALPPELIAINTPNPQGRKAIQNVLHNIQQLVKGVSASDPTEVAAAPLPPPTFEASKFEAAKFEAAKFEAAKFEAAKFEAPKFEASKFEAPKFETAKFEPPKERKEEKKSDTPRKSKPTSKPWRPTLMPITPENLAKIAREPTQVAVDGRHLPSLVQVMSSGKRFHITLQDYNKMCIMRREKLQQLQDGEAKTKRPDDTVITEIQPSTMLGNGGTLVQNITIEKETEKREMPELSQISSNAAAMLKNVGLKNITIAPIPQKTATVTSQTIGSPIVSSPSLLVTSTPMKLPQLGPSVSITSETILTPNLPIMSASTIMPKIPKSLTVIPQTIMASIPNMVLPQGMVVTQSMMMPQGLVVPQAMVVPTAATQMVVQTAEGPRP